MAELVDDCPQTWRAVTEKPHAPPPATPQSRRPVFMLFPRDWTPQQIADHINRVRESAQRPAPSTPK
jgi:hypothetical protein